MKLKFRAHAPSRFHMLCLFLLAFTVAATLLRTLSLLLFFDAEIGYFQASCDLVLDLYIFEGLALALCAALPFLINKAPCAKEDTPSTPTFIGAALCALAFAAAAVFLLFRRELVPAPALLILLTAVFCVLAAFYFALRLRAASPETLAWFGYGAILASAMILAVTYFDRYTPMNAPHKVSLHVSLLCIMLALLLEQRTLLDRALPRFEIGVTFFAFFLCTTVGLSNVIGFMGGAFDSHLYFFFDLILLALAVYFGAKCARIVFPAPQEESEVEQ